ncbi:HAUS augmin-like complex subunit 6 N-terminus-domain-containing protein [Xylariomycetidae sp. FL2044]|nr:HAUS augmin-like complex subunit 6 N-terminus-domain-containing protein [Xylariomycetidae sp. FL2044]
MSHTSIARSRSLRVPSKATLTAPYTSASTNNSTQVPSSTSNVSLFLTNLHLLDLDHKQDWPDISTATFSAKDAAGGQKRRIHCVEWALYHLFQLWDYAETQNKLRPFYPPLDQVQSLNLRAALLRALEQAKKNGTLGRDAPIRKTMLDECKGERLEEVLAVFSSAVLKKLVADRAISCGPEYLPTTSEKIAVENWGYAGDRTHLNALLLAHKVSLTSLLTRKTAARTRYRDFEELLALKERSLVRRAEQSRTLSKLQPPNTSEKAKADTLAVVRGNWTGNERWLDSLFFTDTQPGKGGLLGTKFDDVWTGVQHGSISDFEDQQAGLLEQLGQRVRLQRARFTKWDDFRKKLFDDKLHDASEEGEKETKPKPAGFGFMRHLQLDIDQGETPTSLSAGAFPQEYTTMLESMKTELNAAAKPKMPSMATLFGLNKRGEVDGSSRNLNIPSENPEPISDLSEWEDEPEEDVQPIRKSVRPPKNHTYHGRNSNFSYAPSQPLKTKAPSTRDVGRSLEFNVVPGPSSQYFVPATAAEESKEPEISGSIAGASSTIADLVEGLSPLRESQPTVTSREATSPPSPLLPPSPTQALADEILASVSNASPSPTKKPRHTLSLAERTRMSMSRTKSFEPEDETPQKSSAESSHPHINVEPPKDPEQGEEYEDLVARTRRSMAGFDAARQKAQLERRRSQRKSRITHRKDSYFPKLEEEDVGDTSVADELMEGQQEDYEAIFRSRPRIKTSPGPSPERA